MHQVKVTWTRTGDPEHPYGAEVEGCRWLIRLGDFPAEPLYTLLVDGAEIGSFDTWPETWARPTS